ncbi:MAG: Ppx/GppA phosphatase family protein [Bacteriovoracia bacterium]
MLRSPISTVWLLSLACASVAMTTGAWADSVTRCALDIGSGETKAAAATVRTEGDKVVVEKAIFSKVAIVPIRDEIDKQGTLSDKAIRQLMKQVQAYKQECIAAGATQFAGVATAGFRAATKNGAKALAQIAKKTGFQLRILDGAEEAQLGLLTATTALGQTDSPMVVWDLGGGSMQFATKAAVISIPVGGGAFRDEMLERFRRKPGKSLNPLSSGEMKQAVDTARHHAAGVPESIRNTIKLPNAMVVGIGGIHIESIGKQAKAVDDGKHTSYTLAAAQAARASVVGKDDAWFKSTYPGNKYPQNQASNLAMVTGVMEALGIQRVTLVRMNLADGLLRDPKAWVNN